MLQTEILMDEDCFTITAEGAYLLELLNSAEEDTHVALEATHGEAGHGGSGLRTKVGEHVHGGEI
jgi:hypothetical protein